MFAFIFIMHYGEVQLDTCVFRQSSHTWRRVQSSVSKCAFFVIFAMESSKSDTDTEQTFRRPSEPGPSFRAPEAVRSRGGKRRGSGRKRKHEEGYENVRSSLWKTISLHANVYEEWMALRTAHNFKENSAFAQFLLKRAANAATDAEMTFRSDISTQAAGLER